jgi:plasmid replication initiation protein
MKKPVQAQVESPAVFIDIENDDEEVSTLTPLLKRVSAMEKKAKAKAQAKAEAGPVVDEKQEAAQQLDLFVADLLDYNLKGDMATMEAPMFSLSTRPDMNTWKWASPDGKKWLEVTPSSIGRATMHDKDLLIYVASQLVAAMNTAVRENTKMPGRRVRFTLYDFLITTKRGTAGTNYKDMEKTVDRLAGTRLKTNIELGPNLDDRTGFGLIEDFRYLVKTDGRGKKKMDALEVTLSRWLYRALETRNILTLNPDYFTLRKPLEKRLYELACKHVGKKQPDWEITEPNLYKKCGSLATTFEFTRMLKDIAAADTLLEYRITRIPRPKAETMVRFYLKDPKKLALAYAAREEAKVNAEAKKSNGRKPGPTRMQLQKDLLD